MTCIVAIKEKNNIYFGGDSAAIDAGTLSIAVRNDAKVFRNKKMLIGFSGSFRAGQLMRFKFKPPEHKKGVDDYEYMCTDVVKKIQKCFEDNGLDGHNKKQEKETSVHLLIAYNGTIYEIDIDYQVGIPAENYCSIGGGSDLALGALFAVKNAPMKPEDKLKIALDAASKFNASVLPPYNIMKL